jgi:mannan endo-1,4-beta-mannosidase
MELCLGEYNFGGSDNITGGLAQADVFGILAREKVDLAFIWHTPEGTQNLAWQLFCSYDGRGGRFGETFIPSENSHAGVPVYSAKRKDGAMTIAVINKNLRGSCELTLDVAGLRGKMRVWRFDQESGGKVIEVVKEAATVDGVIKLTLPAASASMLVVE